MRFARRPLGKAPEGQGAKGTKSRWDKTRPQPFTMGGEEIAYCLARSLYDFRLGVILKQRFCILLGLRACMAHLSSGLFIEGTRVPVSVICQCQFRS